MTSSRSGLVDRWSEDLSKDPVSGWEVDWIPRQNFTPVDWATPPASLEVEVEIEVRGRRVGGMGATWEGARNEGSSRGGRVQDSSSSNRRMPGRGRASQTRTQGGTRER